MAEIPGRSWQLFFWYLPYTRDNSSWSCQDYAQSRYNLFFPGAVWAHGCFDNVNHVLRFDHYCPKASPEAIL